MDDIQSHTENVLTVKPRSAEKKPTGYQALALKCETLLTRQVGDEGLRPISFESLNTGLLYTFQKPSVSTPTLSGFTAMVAKKWRGLNNPEKAVLNLLLACNILN